MKLKYELAILAVSLLFIVALFLVRDRRAPGFIREFFNAEAYPTNLAIFRIVFFIALACSFSVSNTIWFSSLPPELRFAPPGLQWFLSYLPINENWGAAASVLLLFFCITAAIGLFTRASAIACVILGFYVLGIPQFFGKINHNHHLLWFTTILALSPCADVLSVDALRLAWSRADSGIIEPPVPSRSYALPLRFIWLTMGLIYFSAGFWKAWTGGYRWAFSDNPRNMFYNKWMEFGSWTPFFRIDRYPLLYQLSAAATIAFELSFIVMIFFPAIRFLAVLGGLTFHNMTRLFMRIPFWELQVCYVSFVDWHRFFRFLGRRLCRGEMYLIYDGNCRICRRAVASLRSIDVFERVTWLNAFNRKELNEHGLGNLPSDDLVSDIHLVAGSKVWRGFEAYRKVAFRLPALWPFIPFLYLPPLPRIGRALYRHVADSRACDISNRSVMDAVQLKARRSAQVMVIVSVLLLYGAAITAVAKINSWPFAGYPSFEDLDQPEVTLITMQVETPAGVKAIYPFKDQGNQQMSPDRLMALLGKINEVEAETERRSRLRALWGFWSKDRPDLQSATTVRFYRDTVSSLPQDQNDNLLHRQLLYELRLPN